MYAPSQRNARCGSSANNGVGKIELCKNLFRVDLDSPLVYPQLSSFKAGHDAVQYGCVRSLKTLQNAKCVLLSREGIYHSH